MTPFAVWVKTSRITSVRCIQKIFSGELPVCPNSWPLHLMHLRAFLREIATSKLTISLNKTTFAKPDMRNAGHITGSGGHRRGEK